MAKTGGGRASIIFPAILLAVPMLWIYRAFAGQGLWTNITIMLFLGVCIGGPGNLFPSAVVADLSSQTKGTKAISTVAGIVDGSGSVGAALGQICVALLEKALGWNAVFNGFIVALVLSALCMIHLFVRDVRTIYQNSNNKANVM
jgi:OPA family glycerol-3-phosphate transporter-like MFS transporter 3